MAKNLMVEQLVQTFVLTHGRAPDAVMRSPGRINIIGEHTDYSHLPVLPVAIQRATYVAVAGGEPGLVEARSLSFEGRARLDWNMAP